MRQSAHREADRQFSFIRGPEPQKAESSASGLEDGGLLPLVVMAFKLFVKSRAGARNADEFGSRLRVVTLSGGKFSEVRARCTSGRRRTTSVIATAVGSGGSGTFGGGTGGLRGARRALKRAKSQRKAVEYKGCLLLTASRHPYFHFENVHRLLYLELVLVLHHQCKTNQLSRYLYCRCAHDRRDS